MPDFKLLSILTISCNTIGTEGEDRDVNCSKNRHHTHDVGSEQCCAYTGPKGAVKEPYCYTNTGENSNLNNSNALTSMVKNNDVKYFLPGPSQESNRRGSAEIKNNYKGIFRCLNGIGCFDGMFLFAAKAK